MNPYTILGITSKASKSEIKKAFLSKAKLYHPDVSTGSAEKFKELMWAYHKVLNQKVPNSDEYKFDFSSVVKKYERPANGEKKRVYEKNREQKSETLETKLFWPGFFFTGTIAGIWLAGQLEDFSIAKDLETEYAKSSNSLQFKIYESALSGKSEIKF